MNHRTVDSRHTTHVTRPITRHDVLTLTDHPAYEMRHTARVTQTADVTIETDKRSHRCIHVRYDTHASTSQYTDPRPRQTRAQSLFLYRSYSQVRCDS